MVLHPQIIQVLESMDMDSLPKLSDFQSDNLQTNNFLSLNPHRVRKTTRNQDRTEVKRLLTQEFGAKYSKILSSERLMQSIIKTLHRNTVKKLKNA